MKKTLKIALVTAALGLTIIPNFTFAQFGVARRTARRTTVVVGNTVAKSAAASSSAAQQQAAAANQQAAAAKQQTAAAQQETAAAQQQTAAAQQEAAAANQRAAAAEQDAAIARGKLPLGTVAQTLPAGCKAIVASGVEYQQCGPNYYRAVFQGNNLVYVTAEPK